MADADGNSRKYPIAVQFKFTTARYVEYDAHDPNLARGEFVDHKSRLEPRVVHVQFMRDGKIKFHGGPTGHESYYIAPELFENLRVLAETGKTFCICAGTTNSWPECEVPADAVMRAFDDAFGIRKIPESQDDQIERASVKLVEPDAPTTAGLRVAHGQELNVAPGELGQIQDSV